MPSTSAFPLTFPVSRFCLMWRSSGFPPFKSYLAFLCLALLPSMAAGQESVGEDEVGAPFFLEHFRPQDYQHYPQNWSVIQDQRGIVYVGNKDGVMEYDGVSWRLIKTATVVRSLALGKKGTVYVGTSGDFGYLAPDSTDTFYYVSLADKVVAEDREYSDIWGTHATSEGVYFQAKERLFRWDGNAMRVWKSERGFHTSFVVHDQLFLRDRNIGLFQVTGDALHLAPGGNAFARRSIYMMVDHGEGRILIGTRNAGFFEYQDGVLTPFPTEADPILSNFNLYHGCALPGGFYVLATLGSGVLIIDNQGRLVQILNEASGFPDDWINYVYADAQGGLWMASDVAGIVRVDMPSQLTVYNDELDLDGTVDAMQRYQGTVYVGTSTGLFKLEQPIPGTHRKIPSIIEVLEGVPVPDLVVADSILIAATHKGLYVIRDKTHTPKKIAEDTSKENTIFSLLESRIFPGIIWVGKKNGLARLSYTAEAQWVLKDLYSGKTASDDIRSIAEDGDGVLWLGATNGTVLRLRFPERGQPVVDLFTSGDGVPEDLLDIISVEDEVVFVAKHGLYRFDPQGKGITSFYRDASLLPTHEMPSTLLLGLGQSNDGNVWMVFADRVVIATPQADGSYRHETPAVLRFSKSTVVSLYLEDDGIAWIGNGDELIRYDPSIDKTYDTPFSVLVRRILATRTEQVIYGGAPMSPGTAFPVLDYDDNALRFEVGALTYNDVASTQYQYYLEGNDDSWSEWTTNPSLTFHGLSAGIYKFRVRARNAQGVESAETVFMFRILPPWYQTWWAYLFYLVTVLAVVAFSWRHYQVVEENKRVQEQARELERERELNKRLQEANESLRQANQLKDTFLANTSHELRTPLTAILGFTSLLREEVPPEFQEFLDPIESNGRRLLNTLNSLLDIAQIRAGMMEVNFQQVDLGKETAETMRLLAPLARQNSLQFDFVRSPEPIYARLDRQYLGRILTNLIGNAIKFTNEGSVCVEVAQREGWVCVHVRDTGVGIDEGFLPHLFDEFKQESSGLARLHEGNGLGLTITARLVELMDGRIEVQSKKGEGSVFTVSFTAHVPDRPPQTRPLAKRQAGKAGGVLG